MHTCYTVIIYLPSTNHNELFINIITLRSVISLVSCRHINRVYRVGPQALVQSVVGRYLSSASRDDFMMYYKKHIWCTYYADTAACSMHLPPS